MPSELPQTLMPSREELEYVLSVMRQELPSRPDDMDLKNAIRYAEMKLHNNNEM